MAATLASSMAATAVATATRCTALLYLPPRFSTPSIKRVSEYRKILVLKTKASSSDETSTSIDGNELITDLKENLPKIMELVGLGYTGWFVYRYLLFKQSRQELATDIEALKKKIAGIE